MAANIPVYPVVGNHDIGNAPSPADIATYTNHFGPDHYTFRHAGFVGIVLNSVIIHTPQHTAKQLAEQELWLQAELKRPARTARSTSSSLRIIPGSSKPPTNPTNTSTSPANAAPATSRGFARRASNYLFSAHYHRNAVARDGNLEAITTGPVGKPLGKGESGLRVVIVRDGRIEHRFYHFGELPNRIDLGAASPQRPAT